MHGAATAFLPQNAFGDKGVDFARGGVLRHCFEKYTTYSPHRSMSQIILASGERCVIAALFTTHIPTPVFESNWLTKKRRLLTVS